MADDRQDALEALYDAGCNWLDELNSYIIPGADEQDVPGYQEQAGRLQRALDRLGPEIYGPAAGTPF